MNKTSGILDPVKSTLCTDVFDASGHVYKHILDTIKYRVRTLIPPENIVEMFLIGSVTGYQWTETSDIDVNVIVSPPELSDHGTTLNNIRHEMNGKLIPGTRHPLNYFLSPYLGKPSNWQDSAFGVYNILEDTWEKSPGESTQFLDPSIEYSRELLTARQLEKIFIRLVVNYKKAILELKQLETLHDSTALKQKLAECRVKFSSLLDFVKFIDEQRKLNYYYGWGVPRKNWDNLVFKIIESSVYGPLFESLKELRIKDHYATDSTVEGAVAQLHTRYKNIF